VALMRPFHCSCLRNYIGSGSRKQPHRGRTSGRGRLEDQVHQAGHEQDDREDRDSVQQRPGQEEIRSSGRIVVDAQFFHLFLDLGFSLGGLINERDPTCRVRVRWHTCPAGARRGVQDPLAGVVREAINKIVNTPCSRNLAKRMT